MWFLVICNQEQPNWHTEKFDEPRITALSLGYVTWLLLSLCQCISFSSSQLIGVTHTAESLYSHFMPTGFPIPDPLADGWDHD